MASVLKKDPTIKGIKVGQKEIKITQYADDTTVLVRDLYSVTQLCISQFQLRPALFSIKEAYSTIFDKSFSTPTAEGRILNHGFTKEEIPNIYMLPFKILKEPKLIMFQVKIIHIILPTQSSLFNARITDTHTHVCPICNLESQSLKHMLIICSVSSSFWTCFSNW